MCVLLTHNLKIVGSNPTPATKNNAKSMAYQNPLIDRFFLATIWHHHD